MKSRTLAVGTLLSLVSFCSLVKMAGGQANSGMIPSSRAELALVRTKAEGGDATAQYLLGKRYMTGQGVAQDFKEALKWFGAAAAQGSADAEFSLGYLYEKGTGTSRDYRQA